MYYTNDNLSILQAVTKSTLETSILTTHTDIGSPPSPVAPAIDPNDSENDYSYAFISTGEIDLAAIKKKKAKRLMEGEEASYKSKGDVMQEKDNVMTGDSQATRLRYYLVLFAALTICLILGMLLLLEDGNGTNHLTSTINNTKDALGQTEWQNYIDKLQWDQSSKTWLHQEKAMFFSRLSALRHYLVEQSHIWFQKGGDHSHGWIDKAIQSVMVFVDRWQ